MRNHRLYARTQPYLRCGGKQKHSRSDALRTIRDMQVDGRGSDRLNAYRCENCGRWHVGNKR